MKNLKFNRMRLFDMIRSIICLYGFHKWDYRTVNQSLEDSKGNSKGNMDITYRSCRHCSAEEVPFGLMDWKRISVEYGNVWEMLLRNLTVGLLIMWYLFDLTQH